MPIRPNNAPAGQEVSEDKMRRSVICFGEDWDRHPGSAQDIMQRLSNTRKVLWVDSLGLRRPRLTMEDGKRAVIKIFNWLKGARSARNTLFVFCPLVIPFYKSKFVRTINRTILRISIKRLIKKYKLTEPVLWVSCPSAEGVVGELGEVKSIYYCADEHSVFPGMSQEIVTILEESLFKKVDLVIVTSQNLYESKKSYNRNIQLIPHGVDFDHFSKAALPNTVVPTDILHIKKPIIGFYGLIQDLIDFELIRYLAEAEPNWSIVMIGPVIFDAGSLPSLPNLHFIGPRRLQELPNYVKGFDVCMIPYKLVVRTMYANPLKLRQYLASGKPVVSTSLPEVMRYDGLVKIAKDPDEYIDHIQFLLQHDTMESSRKRMDAVRGESWHLIMDKIEALL